MKKIVSWNVNGLRACLKKGFAESMAQLDADIICLQETKMEQWQANIDIGGIKYIEYWNSAVKKGYSGTAVFTKIPPINVSYGIRVLEHDNEGRVITLEYDGFFLVNTYAPNTQRNLMRLGYRIRWEDAFREYVCSLDKSKPVIICGDLNVAHTEIDLKNPKSNEHNAGYTLQEREKMTALLNAGFTDFYRQFHPDTRDVYTWWSYIGNSREKNTGWRIDYFLGSNRLTESVKDAHILTEIRGSDHCPVMLVIV